MVVVLEVDVVIINLIYFVVVLKYDLVGGGVLLLLVKGNDFLVLKICEVV